LNISSGFFFQITFILVILYINFALETKSGLCGGCSRHFHPNFYNKAAIFRAVLGHWRQGTFISLEALLKKHLGGHRLQNIAELQEASSL
jgi:hypothetical protein